MLLLEPDAEARRVMASHYAMPDARELLLDRGYHDTCAPRTRATVSPRLFPPDSTWVLGCSGPCSVR